MAFSDVERAVDGIAYVNNLRNTGYGLFGGKFLADLLKGVKSTYK